MGQKNPSFLDGRDAHPTRTIKNVSYLILIPKSIPVGFLTPRHKGGSFSSSVMAYTSASVRCQGMITFEILPLLAQEWWRSPLAIVRDESVAMSVKSQMSIKPLSSNVSGKHKDRERLAAQSAWRVAGPNQVLMLRIYCGKCLPRGMPSARKSAIR
jgi:hypothetical protein